MPMQLAGLRFTSDAVGNQGLRDRLPLNGVHQSCPVYERLFTGLARNNVTGQSSRSTLSAPTLR